MKKILKDCGNSVDYVLVFLVSFTLDLQMSCFSKRLIIYWCYIRITKKNQLDRCPFRIREKLVFILVNLNLWPNLMLECVSRFVVKCLNPGWCDETLECPVQVLKERKKLNFSLHVIGVYNTQGSCAFGTSSGDFVMQAVANEICWSTSQ